MSWSRLRTSLALLVLSLALVPLAPQAASAEGPPLPEFIDIHDVIPSMTTTAGLVRDTIRIGNRVYIAGSFTGLRETNNGPVIDQRYLAAVDASTGEIIQSFDPVLNDQVRTLGAAPDGSRLYIGGNFTTIDGESVANAAALNPSNGNVVPWTTVQFGPVTAIVVEGSGDVFLGGYFGRVGGMNRDRLAKVSASGTVRSWEADLSSNDPVKSMALSPDGSRLYAGGGYTFQSGPSSGWVFRGFIEAFDASSGNDVGSFSASPGYESFALDTHGDRVYAAQGGPGGRGVVYRASNGSQERSFFADGDVQEVRVIGNKAYYGGHFTEEFGGRSARWVATVDLDDLSIDGTTFTPGIGGGLGVWTFDFDGDHLWIGGDINSASHHPAVGFARFSEVPHDETPPAKPANLHVAAATGSSLTLDWNAITHSVPFTYIVKRNGVQRAELFGQTTFTDTGLQADTVYQYEVNAETIYAVEGKVAKLTAATPPPTTTGLIASGNSWRYLDTGASLGASWRDVGFDHSSWSQGPSELGYGDGDEATVVSAGPSGNHHITTYFRRTFNLGGGQTVLALEVDIVVDDGAVVYLNGTEVVRQNMPGGTITSSTTASANAANETAFTTYTLDPSLLDSGWNVLAVEIHQVSAGSSDISFDARLRASLVAPSKFVTKGSTWRYDDDGDKDGKWKKKAFDDSSWDAGSAELGYGDGDESTVTSNGTVTTYFRREFQVSDLDHVRTQKVRVKIRRDDGAVVYLNGEEIARSNMPGGKIKHKTKASSTVKGKSERKWYVYTVPADRLRKGKNVVAVELHQDAKDSKDATFDLKFFGLA
jgi:hypothetical protein